VLGALAASALLAAGCGGSDEADDPTAGEGDSTELRVHYEHPDAGVELDYTIACDDAATVTGDEVEVDAADACEALRRTAVVERLVEPPTDRVCTEIYGGPDVSELTGTVDGEPVRTTVDRANGCGIADWDDLLNDVLPAPIGVVDPDTSSTSAAPTTPVDPTTTSPATTTTSSTTTTTTTTTTGASTTTGAPPPERLDAWPEPPAPAELADVPYLLPAGPIDGVVDAVREETEVGPAGAGIASGDHVQFWVADDGSSQVIIRTHLSGRPTGSEEFRVDVEVDPWAEAFTFADTGAFAGVTLVDDDDGYVADEAFGIATDDLCELARTMTRRTNGAPGWEIDADGLVPVHDGWTAPAIGSANREIDWFGDDGRLEAELSISIGQPGRFGPAGQRGTSVTFADVDGSPAVVLGYDFGSAPAPSIVLWSPTPDLVVQFGVVGPPERALEIARGIAPVPEDIWNWVAGPAGVDRDGCATFVC
jgi:hypothetical protein